MKKSKLTFKEKINKKLKIPIIVINYLEKIYYSLANWKTLGSLLLDVVYWLIFVLGFYGALFISNLKVSPEMLYKLQDPNNIETAFEASKVVQNMIINVIIFLIVALLIYSLIRYFMYRFIYRKYKWDKLLQNVVEEKRSFFKTIIGYAVIKLLLIIFYFIIGKLILLFFKEDIQGLVLFVFGLVILYYGLVFDGIYFVQKRMWYSCVTSIKKFLVILPKVILHAFVLVVIFAIGAMILDVFLPDGIYAVLVTVIMLYLISSWRLLVINELK